jgi:lysozyme family protein
MKSTLVSAEKWCELDEGAYTNDPDDPGGLTKFGITLEDYRSYISPTGTAEDVAALELPQAFKIYKERYWDPCSCDALPVGVDYFTFDSAILSGVGTAIRWLQRAVGATPDGRIGPKTMAAVAADHPLDILLKMEALRRQRLHTLPTWWKYGRGWTNRVNRAVTRSKKLIAAEPALPAHPTPATPVGTASPRFAGVSPVPENANVRGSTIQAS